MKFYLELTNLDDLTELIHNVTKETTLCNNVY